MGSLIPDVADDRPLQGPGSWRVRRAFMFVVCLFCMATVVYTLGTDMRSRVAESAVTMSFATIGMALGSYVFGAAWQDISTAQSRRDDYTSPYGGHYGHGHGRGGPHGIYPVDEEERTR